MTDHLPECESFADPTGVSYDADGNRNVCICAPLRACEQRMYEWSKSFGVGKTFYDAGRLDALDAAEAAVAADDIPPRWWKSMFFGGRRARHWCQYGWDWKKHDALAAIRALKDRL